MTRDDFIERYRHEISGAVMDVLFSNAEGGERSIRIRALLRKIDTMLGSAYDSLKVATNGTPNPVRK